MGMDVYGKNPQCESGEYFRNNVWWWRPLATYCCERAPGITSHCKYWQSNDGDGLNDEQSRKLAQVLRRDLRTGYTQRYEKRYKSEINVLKDEKCPLCDGTGKRTDMEVANGCNGCKGTGKRRPIESWYSFTAENVAEFAEFLENCGGFKIC